MKGGLNNFLLLQSPVAVVALEVPSDGEIEMNIEVNMTNTAPPIIATTKQAANIEVDTGEIMS